MSRGKLILSPLGHTWVFDLDGTVVKHNGYIIDGHDTLLDGAAEFLAKLPEGDLIILMTARKDAERNSTIEFLKMNNIRFDHIIFNAPYGERIIVNDKKPSGLITSVAVNTERDQFLDFDVVIDETL